MIGKTFAMTVVLLGASLAVEAQTSDSTPAVFLPDQAFENHIKFPEGEDAIFVSIPCLAEVSRLGKLALSQYQCFYTDRSALPFLKSIKAAIPDVRLSPATRGGEPVKATLAFAVHYLRRDGEKSVKVALNLGTSSALLGPDYIGPQIINWEYDRLSCGPVDALWPKMLITAQGDVLNVEIDAPKAKPVCIDYIRNKLARASFIPAQKDGRPVDSFFSFPLTGFYTSMQDEVRIKTGTGN